MTIIQHALCSLGLYYMLNEETVRNKAFALVMHDRLLLDFKEEVNQQYAMAARRLADGQAT